MPSPAPVARTRDEGQAPPPGRLSRTLLVTGLVMGWFDRIFGRKSRSSRRWSAKSNARLPNPGMLVLLNAPPKLDVIALQSGIAAIEPLTVPAKFTSRLADEGEPAGGNVVYGTCEFDSHKIAVVGLDVPLPPAVLERTVGASHWTGQGREEMQNHKAHYVLMHQGGGANPLEKYIALYKLALALAGESLAGVLIEDAWTCAPAAVAREFSKAEFLAACREQIPPILFTGFVKFIEEDRAWFASKGHHVFGTPDFVMEGGASEQPSEALDLFMNIFLYVTASGRELLAGHTMQIAEEIFLRFGELTDAWPHRDLLAGPVRTLTIKRISKDEINQPGADDGDV